jgi:hypothetical protein
VDEAGSAAGIDLGAVVAIGLPLIGARVTLSEEQIRE